MAIDHLRKHKREDLSPGVSEDEDAPDDLELLSDPGGTPEEQIIEELSVEEALSKLKPVYREIISMKVLSDMTFKEIAEVLKMPMGTVTWNYQQAIKILRRFGYE